MYSKKVTLLSYHSTCITLSYSSISKFLHFYVVQQELDLAFPDPSDICDEQKFMNADLSYLTRVINESMRVNPVISGVSREAGIDTVYEGMLTTLTPLP